MKAKRGSKKRNSVIGVVIMIVVLISVVLGRFNNDFDKVNVPTADSANSYSAFVKVHIIDVGQGSSALVQCGETGILIDAGEIEYGDTVVDYLKNSGIKMLDYAVISHPHSDHMGGMLKVLKSFKVKNVIMPQLSSKNMPTTRLYENLLLLLDEKDVNVIAASYGSRYNVGLATLETYGPVEQASDLNNMSVICKVKAASTTFLFPGDAQSKEMKSINTLSPDLKCQVYAMAHHGSSSSLNKQFLNNADFDVAVISCGSGNSYGHPHKEVLSYLKKNNKEYYRTDKDGNIIFTCNEKGYNISFN